MKKPLLVIIPLLIIVAFFVLKGSSEDSWVCSDGNWVKHGSPSAPMPMSGCGIIGEEIDGETITFAKAGAITVNNPGLKPGVPYLVYEEPGKPAVTQQLVINEMSVCVSGTGSLPCVAMSVSPDVAFHGKQAVVEGIIDGDVVAVRVLRIFGENDLRFVPEPGRLFISWADAQTLIRKCNVRQVSQAHSLAIYLERKDGKEFYTIEPMIDDIFEVVQENSVACGDIIMATE